MLLTAATTKPNVYKNTIGEASLAIGIQPDEWDGGGVKRKPVPDTGAAAALPAKITRYDIERLFSDDEDDDDINDDDVISDITFHANFAHNWAPSPPRREVREELASSALPRRDPAVEALVNKAGLVGS
jgi:hypothetical protein